MSQITNPTQPLSIQPNAIGGLIIQGSPDIPNRINGSTGSDQIILGSGNDEVAGLGGNEIMFARYGLVLLLNTLYWAATSEAGC